MDNPRPHLRRGFGGEFWLLIAVLTLLATIALLHLAVQRERNSGLTAVDVQTMSELFTALSTTPVVRNARSPG